MKPILSALLTLAVFAVLAIVATTSKRSVRAVYAESGCSVATLDGNYAFSQPGFEAKNTKGLNPLPFADVGVATFDGSGNFTVTATDQSPGKPTPIYPSQGPAQGPTP